ncbi:uncharacterized protein LOC129228437 [Uloborus diversus]|nr:uncharacterized protein LOC129228437 [Uloborus diversus]
MIRSPGVTVRTPQIMTRSPHMMQRPMMQSMVTPPRNMAPRRTFQPNTMVRPATTVPINNVRRNLTINKPMPNTNDKFNNILGQKAVTNADPLIVSVHSAGLPVANKEPSFNPVISGIESVNNASGNSITTGLNLPSSLSVSVADDSEAAQPTLLSRSPYSSVNDLSEEDFLSSHKTSIKRLLMHNISEITPSRCVQLKLTPNPTASDEEQKYTSSFARSFLKKLESLGFGICDGPKNGSLRHFVFKKKKYSALTDKQVKILQNVNVSETQYNKCFISTTSQKTNQNGSSVVCLE